MSGESEPEEGEITESDGEKELSSASSSSSSASPVQPEHDSPEGEMETQMQEGEEGSKHFAPWWLFGIGRL